MFTFLPFVGLTKSDIEIVSLSQPDAVAAYIRGDVDAVVTADPYSLKMEQAGARLMASANHSYVPGKEGPNKFAGIHSVVWANESFISKNPRTVQAILKAMIDGTKYIASNPDDAAALVGQAINLAPADAKKMMSHNTYDLNVSTAFVTDLETNAKFLVEQGALKRLPPSSEWIDVGPLSTVDAKLVTWKP